MAMYNIAQINLALGQEAIDSQAMLGFVNRLDEINAIADQSAGFVYKSLHVELIRDRDAWFAKMPEMHQALWWVPQGHYPSIDEAKERLAHPQKNDATVKAFTFAKPFVPSAEQPS